jgi:hypothetical protein
LAIVLFLKVFESPFVKGDFPIMKLCATKEAGREGTVVCWTVGESCPLPSLLFVLSCTVVDGASIQFGEGSEAKKNLGSDQLAFFFFFTFFFPLIFVFL